MCPCQAANPLCKGRAFCRYCCGGEAFVDLLCRYVKRHALSTRSTHTVSLSSALFPSKVTQNPAGDSARSEPLHGVWELPSSCPRDAWWQEKSCPGGCHLAPCALTPMAAIQLGGLCCKLPGFFLLKQCFYTR